MVLMEGGSLEVMCQVGRHRLEQAGALLDGVGTDWLFGALEVHCVRWGAASVSETLT